MLKLNRRSILLGISAKYLPISMQDGGKNNACSADSTLNIGTFQSIGATTVDPCVKVIRTSGHSADGVGAATYKLVDRGPATSWRAQSQNGLWFEMTGTDVQPEQFGAVGDGVSDDLFAFQRAANFLQDRKGGKITLDSKRYLLKQYKGGQVDGRLLFKTNATDQDVSKTWLIPTGVSVVGNGATLAMGGGASTALGFSTGANILVYSGPGEISQPVTRVNQAANAIDVQSSAPFMAGQRVRLLRPGRVGSQANTPSQEDAPQQFLTIASIDGETIAFHETFAHRFEMVEALELWGFSDHRDYASNVSLDDVTIESTGGDVVYVLFSRVMNCGFGKVALKPGVGFSFGMSENMTIDNLVSTLSGDTSAGSIESCTFKIGSISIEGNGSKNSMGSLLINDHSAGSIDNFTARNFRRTGLALLYGTNIRIQNCELIDCGTDATADTGYFAALSIGFPATGTYSTVQVARMPMYDVRNSGPSTTVIDTLSISGITGVPIRVHDADVTIRSAKVQAPPGKPMIIAGESGANRDDPTWYPQGGRTSLRIENLQGTSAGGSPRLADANGGYQGLYATFATTLSTPAAADSPTLQVKSIDRIAVGQRVYASNEKGSYATPSSRAVTAISGLTLMLEKPFGYALAAEQGVWTPGPQPNVVENIQIGQLRLNGVSAPTTL